MKIINETQEKELHGVKYMNRGPDIDWGIITLQPGDIKLSHYHQQMGETFYILEGITTFIVTIKNQEKDIKLTKGNAIRLKENEAHELRNETDSITKVIFIKEKYLPDDKIECK